MLSLGRASRFVLSLGESRVEEWAMKLSAPCMPGGHLEGSRGRDLLLFLGVNILNLGNVGAIIVPWLFALIDYRE